MLTDDLYREWLNDNERMSHGRVFFVVGCQRSGTTWVQHLLHGHPHVACRGEGHLVDLLLAGFRDLFETYFNNERVTHTLAPDELLGVVRYMTDRLLLAYRDAKPDPAAVHVVGDKTPEAALGITGLDALYPASRFIHVIRDGRDGVVSGWAQTRRRGATKCTFAEYAEIFACEHWVRYVHEARAAGRQLGERYLEIRYEALHEHPATEARRLLEFLDVDAGDNAVARCLEAGSFDRLSGGRRRGDEDAGSHFRKGVVGEWRTQFDDEAIRRFETHAGDLLHELGYASTPASV